MIEARISGVNGQQGRLNLKKAKPSSLRTVEPSWPYSVLKACAGSIEAARRAGINPASTAAAQQGQHGPGEHSSHRCP